MRKISLLLAIIGFISVLGLIIKFGFLFNRCEILNSNIIKIRPGIYVSAKLNCTTVHELSEQVDEALARNRIFWGRYPKDLHLIFCSDIQECERYSGLKRCGTSTQFTPFGTYITISPEGRNVDVISHEISHSILEEEIGYFSILRIPTWINEGIAMQVDNREDFTFPDLEKNYKPDARKFSEISTPKSFYAANNEILKLNYAISKYQVLCMIKNYGDVKEFLKYLKNS
jgi:hypothetical protein